jgi:sigma-E factor negative regulatory protein RseB
VPAAGNGCGRRLGFGLALVLLPLISGAGEREHSPVELLSQMSSALSRFEYEGTLVYLNGHELSTLRIAHHINADGQAQESLLSLSGPVRAVARGRRHVTCVLPDARAISVPRHSASTAILHGGRIDVAQLKPNYLIHELGRSRIAGRDTRVVGIIPRDDLRYGYRFFVDEETGLPLKTDLMDSSATPIEQVMFTDLRLLGDAGEGAAAPAALSSSSGVAGPRPVEAMAAPPVGEMPPWRVAELPRGYRVAAGDPAAAAGESERYWLMVSDGLAAVSVYIEPDQGQDQGLSGQKQVGALNAAGRALAGYQITAVGEAPMQTVQAIADAILIQP